MVDMDRAAESEPSRKSVVVGVVVFLLLLALPASSLVDAIREDTLKQTRSDATNRVEDATRRPRAFLSAGGRTVEGSGGLGCWAITEQPVEGDVVGVTSDENGIVGITCADGTPGYIGKVLIVEPGERLTVRFDRPDSPERLGITIDESEGRVLTKQTNPASFDAPTTPGRHYIGVANDWPQGDTWHGFKIDVS